MANHPSPRQSTSPAAPSSSAEKTIDRLYWALEIERKWALRSSARELIWWPHRLPQRIFLTTGAHGDGQRLELLHIETDLLTGVSTDTVPNIHEILAEQNSFMSLSALVFYPEEQRVAMHCRFDTSTNGPRWMTDLACNAAILQFDEAEEVAGYLVEEIPGVQPAYSAHPRRGWRRKHHPMVGVGGFVAETAEQDDPLYSARYEKQMWESVLGTAPVIEDDRERLVTTVAFTDEGLPLAQATGGDPADRKTGTVEVHAVDGTRYGWSAEVMVRLPAGAGARTPLLAGELNLYEATSFAAPPCAVGAWTARDGDLAHVAVWPQMLWERDQLPVLTLLASSEAEGAARYMAENGWL